jgi:hypothetical protein
VVQRYVENMYNGRYCTLGNRWQNKGGTHWLGSCLLVTGDVRGLRMVLTTL